MSAGIYAAVFEAPQGCLAYGAGLLKPLPDLFGTGAKLTASAGEKEAWARERLEAHDALFGSLLGRGGPAGVSLRVILRPGRPEPVQAAYLLRAAARSETRAEEALRSAWDRLSSSLANALTEPMPVTSREGFDRLSDIPAGWRALEVRRPEPTVQLTCERSVEFVVPFADRALRWSHLMAFALGSGTPALVDVCLTRARLTEDEAEELGMRAGLCEAVRRVTGSDIADQAAALCGQWQESLDRGCALVRVAAAVPEEAVEPFAERLCEAFPCAADAGSETVPPGIVTRGSGSAAQAALRELRYMLPPAPPRTAPSPTARLRWLCSMDEAAGLVRPPVMWRPYPPGVEAELPPGLREALGPQGPTVVHTGAYFGERSQISGGNITVNVSEERIGGDKVGGDQIVAGDKSGPQSAGDPVEEASANGGPRCTNCGARFQPGAGYCTMCGAPLPGCCPRCGSPTQADAKFCTRCGEHLRGEPD